MLEAVTRIEATTKKLKSYKKKNNAVDVVALLDNIKVITQRMAGKPFHGEES